MPGQKEDIFLCNCIIVMKMIKLIVLSVAPVNVLYIINKWENELQVRIEFGPVSNSGSCMALSSYGFLISFNLLYLLIFSQEQITPSKFLIFEGADYFENIPQFEFVWCFFDWVRILGVNIRD